jgi:ArsR family transcriptional regulator, arsenate/arsenite/antimonite-responsive transcriptional repressor
VEGPEGEFLVEAARSCEAAGRLLVGLALGGLTTLRQFWNDRTVMNDLDRNAAAFAALGHPARLAIVRHLLAAHPTGLVANELQSELAIPASTLSHHLDGLRQERLIVQEREGKYLRYRVDEQGLKAVLGFLYAECCTRYPNVELLTIGGRRR